MTVALYKRDGKYSFLQGGPNDRPAMTIESTYRVEIDYEHDTATIAGGPCRDPFRPSEFATASLGAGLFGLRRADNIER